MAVTLARMLRSVGLGVVLHGKHDLAADAISAPPRMYVVASLSRHRSPLRLVSCSTSSGK